MADKMLRVAGRSGTGQAKPLKTDKDGSLEVKLSGTSLGQVVNFPAPLEVQKTLTTTFPDNVVDFQHTEANKAIIIDELVISVQAVVSVLIEHNDINGVRKRIKIPTVDSYTVSGTPSTINIFRGEYSHFDMVDYNEQTGGCLFKLSKPLHLPFGGRIRIQLPSDQTSAKVAGVMTYKVLG